MKRTDGGGGGCLAEFWFLWRVAVGFGAFMLLVRSLLGSVRSRPNISSLHVSPWDYEPTISESSEGLLSADGWLLWTSLPLSLVTVVLVLIAFRVQRSSIPIKSLTPYCPGCRSELLGYFPMHLRCPKCGADTAEPNLKRRPLLGALGLILLHFGCLGLLLGLHALVSNLLLTWRAM